MGLVFYALAAMTWNTGQLTSAKIEAQTAADSAAYSSVVWTSRAVNMITATNMHALRDASAMGTAIAVTVDATWIFVWEMIFLARILPLFLNPWTAWIGAGLFVVWTNEMSHWGWFVNTTGWPMTPINDAIRLGNHMAALMAYQRAWVAAVPGLVSQQKSQIEDYYDCDLTLQMGNGSGPILAPLKRGNPLTSSIPFGLRFAYDAMLAGSWRADARMRLIVQGKARLGWLIGALAGGVTSAIVLGQNHHVLVSQWGPLEFGPYGTGAVSPNTWRDYTVVASAQKRVSNVQSAQFPINPLRFMAPGLFDDPVQLRPVAYAQAETFNGIDGLLASVSIHGLSFVQSVISLYPWRVWTDWGWQWQPRLTHGTLIRPSSFQNMGLALPPFNPASRANLSTH